MMLIDWSEVQFRIWNHLWDFKIIYKISKSSGPSCPKADLSAFPGLNFNPGFYISFFQSLLEKIYPILFRTSNDQIASKKIWTEFSFQAFSPEIKFHANPGLTQIWTTQA